MSNEIEQARNDSNMLHVASCILRRINHIQAAKSVENAEVEARRRLSKLEAAAVADPWLMAKRLVESWRNDWRVDTGQHHVAQYAEHLEQRIAELEAELSRRPVVWCVRNREKEYEKGVYGIRLFSTEKDAERYSLDTLHEPYTGEQS